MGQGPNLEPAGESSCKDDNRGTEMLEDQHESEAEQQMVCFQAVGPGPSTAGDGQASHVVMLSDTDTYCLLYTNQLQANNSSHTGSAVEYMQSGKDDLSGLPRCYWKSILVQGYKCGVISSMEELKDAALDIGPKALIIEKDGKPQRNVSMINKIKRQTNILLHPDRNSQRDNELCKELNIQTDELHKGTPARRKEILKFEDKAVHCLVYILNR